MTSLKVLKESSDIAGNEESNINVRAGGSVASSALA